ncbi:MULTISPECIES: secondary thiamine-phosphate synthase enzyme YjbQ [unclassified Candidatus Paralachnospira]|uniref:secondary thiamine-phosphate synthase enzyme YjbQ n=1 Tax=unclassified Candidatus Paralachnospira TaxID=3099471 RepID=UPI003F8F09A5
MNLFKHNVIVSERRDMVKLTDIVKKDVKESGIRNGIVVVHCPHTTAALTINENADPDVSHDILYSLEKTFPTRDIRYRHYEGNSHAHVKSSVMGASVTLILEEGEIILGVWQDLYLCEFDGPRQRTVYVKVMEG